MKSLLPLLLGLVILVLVAFSANERATVFNFQTSKDAYESTYKVYALSLPDSMSFAGENVPLQKPDVRERMDRELLVNTYWQSNMMLMLKRANKYFPTITAILNEEGVPEDFKYLAVIESGLQQVRSYKGATGFWQIMRTTGREMGLEVNANVDERYHVEKATRVACKFLKRAYKKFGSWTLAAASYNRGVAGISRNLRSQKVDNYYDLYLGEETRRYIFRILAVKEIMKYPKKYGFVFAPKDLYEATEIKTVGLDTAITNIARFAQQMGVKYKELKLENPWLRQNHLNNESRKYYEIKIPTTAGD